MQHWIRSANQHRIVLAVILGVHTVLLAHAGWHAFVTVNEVGHVPAGLAHLRDRDFALYRVNPPLPRFLSALCTLPANPPPVPARPSDRPRARPEWRVGPALATDCGPRYLDIVRLARLPGIFWSLLGAWVVSRWARELYGPPAGLLAASLWCFNPLVLAFGSLAVPDVPAAACAVAASYAFWRYCRVPTLGRATLAGVLLGVGLLTKFTLVTLIPAWALTRLLWHREPNSLMSLYPLHWSARDAALMAMAVVLVINLGYAGDGTLTPLEDFQFGSRTLAGPLEAGIPSGNRFAGTIVGRIPVPLPAQFVLGIDTQKADFEGGYRSYLQGEWRAPGWWYYYLYAAAVKLPLGFLALVGGALAGALSTRVLRARWCDELAVGLPGLAVLALVSSQTGYTHHLRYALPALPFLVVFTARLGRVAERGPRWIRTTVVGFAAWTAASTLAARPDYLAFFNVAAGGPENGHRHLINSNLDWGQDLLRLRAWVDTHPDARPVGVAYYNFLTPAMAGIDYRLPPPVRPGESWPGLKPGWYAVSVNLVMGLDFVLTDETGRPVYAPPGGYSYFADFEPVARAGYSIWVYYVSPADAEHSRIRVEGIRSSALRNGINDKLTKSRPEPIGSFRSAGMLPACGCPLK